jgi:3-deoxy-D-manno-octulosonic-acid transferase
MYWFYNSCLALYFLITLPYYALHLVLREHYRAGLWQRLGFIAVGKKGQGVTSGERRVWLHGVSVGEIQTLLSLGERLGNTIRPIYSTTTLTAQRIAAGKLKAGQALIYFPLDIPFAVRRSLDRVRPDFVVLAETELWPNFLRECHRRNIPMILVNGRISERSYGRYYKIRRFTRIFLPWIERFLMQDATYAERIVALGAPLDRVHVTGNMKADSPGLKREVSEDLRKVLERIRTGADARVLVAGSTHDGEEVVLAQCLMEWRKRYPGLTLVIAPRQLKRVRTISQRLQGMGLDCILRSQLNPSGGRWFEGGKQVLILDTLGELAGVYQWADAVFIGKSLCAHGGQNPLEPAGYQKPIIFGPHMENFPQEARELLSMGGAFQVADQQSLQECVFHLLDDLPKLRRAGLRAKLAVENLRGATDKNLGILLEQISKRKSFLHPGD